MSKDIKKALEHCAEWKCDNCPNGDELGSGEIVCRGRLLPQVLEYVSDLEAKLAEYKEQVEIVEKGQSELFITILKAHKDNFELKQQLAEKEKEIEEYKRVCTIAHVEDLQVENMLLKGKEQDKISFAVEKLEKVKKKFNSKRPIDDLANEVGLELGYTATQIQKYIDNQIEELKKEMK